LSDLSLGIEILARCEAAAVAHSHPQARPAALGTFVKEDRA
jgi:hypothetical protein